MSARTLSRSASSGNSMSSSFIDCTIPIRTSTWHAPLSWHRRVCRVPPTIQAPTPPPSRRLSRGAHWQHGRSRAGAAGGDRAEPAVGIHHGRSRRDRPHLRPRRQRRPQGHGLPRTGLDRPAARHWRPRPWPRGHPGVRGRRPDAAEDADPWRTCFERDRDRILHATAFRRLAGKTQVFVFPTTTSDPVDPCARGGPGGHRRGPGLHLNVALTEAIALGHDCGHGPGGHASEDALSPYLDGGFDHAPWGADVSLAPSTCAGRPSTASATTRGHAGTGHPEGEVVSWADRIAYVCHDFEDAVKSGIVTASVLPDVVRERCGDRRGQQLGTFIDALVTSVLATGRIGMAASRPRRWPPSGPAITSTSTSGPARWPRAGRWWPSCRPWSTTSATAPT